MRELPSLSREAAVLCCAVCVNKNEWKTKAALCSLQREREERERGVAGNGRTEGERDCNGQKAFRGEEKSAAMREKGCKRGEYFLYINI